MIEEGNINQTKAKGTEKKDSCFSDSANMKKVNRNQKKKAEKKDVANLTTIISKPGVSANWFTFIRADDKVLKNAIKQDGNAIKSKSKNFKEPIVTKVIALDCEMVSDMEDKDMLGRVSIVNYKLQCIYDKFVKPNSPVGDYRTRFSGLRKNDLEKGDDFDTVHREVKALLERRLLVGHSLQHDFKVLRLGHPRKFVRDTSQYRKFREVNDGKAPSLRKLAKLFLGENIQEGEHSSVEDARTAMKLYIKYRHEWEKYLLDKEKPNHTPKLLLKT